jgi:hypothetical protein
MKEFIEPEVTIQRILININAGRSFSEAIAAGDYRVAVLPDVSEQNFPSNGVVQQELTIVLICFNCLIITREILEQLRERGLEPITVETLLAIGEQKPDLQREFPIVALGSTWEFSPTITKALVLNVNQDKRVIETCSTGWRWPVDYRFAAIEV